MKTRREAKIADQRTNYYWNRLRKYGKRYKKFKWPFTELVLSLVYTHDIVMSHFQRVLSDFDLSISAMNILMILKHDEGNGCTQQELSRLLLVSRANITKVIDGLEKREVVVRTFSQEDRRARVIRLTEAGRALANRVMPRQTEEVSRIVAGLSGSEIGLLSKLLAKFRGSVMEQDGKIK